MSFCPRCGVAAQVGSHYCSNCGSPFATPLGATGGTGPAPGFPTAPAPTSKDTGTAQSLLLVGALLGALVPIVVSFTLLALGTFFAALIPFWGAIPGAFLGAAAVFLFLLAFLWGAVVVHARNLVRSGQRREGGMIAILAGAAMLVLGIPMMVVPALGGLLVLAGGLMAYGER